MDKQEIRRLMAERFPALSDSDLDIATRLYLSVEGKEGPEQVLRWHGFLSAIRIILITKH